MPHTKHSAVTVVTYNIHKGLSHFNRRLVVHDIRERLTALKADVVFLQEVQGSHLKRSDRHLDWPAEPQHEFLAGRTATELEEVHTAYGMNAVYQDGHHGNAVLSRHPIVLAENTDISHHALESRGMLHCEMAVKGWDVPLHCVNVHLGLWGRSRRLQIDRVAERIRSEVPDAAPLVLAGDFNDWRGTASRQLAQALGMVEVFEHMHGRPARSYPARMPVLTLDRIYVRGLKVVSVECHGGHAWARLSDHLALSAKLTR
jgi:endonuclease/exonuclease/phosphatase family metal-dependent hydrolase